MTLNEILEEFWFEEWPHIAIPKARLQIIELVKSKIPKKKSYFPHHANPQIQIINNASNIKREGFNQAIDTLNKVVDSL